MAVWSGLFGFKGIRTRAGIAAGLIEVAAFGVLALAALAAGPASAVGVVAGEPVRLLARLGRGVPCPWRSARSVPSRWPRWPLLGVAEARAGGAPAAAGGAGGDLEDRHDRRRQRAHQRHAA